MTLHVFGYGSLVNARTHDYRAVHPARLPGWQRRWCQAAGRRWAFLAATPAAGAVLDGVIAAVPAKAWPALDAREASYDRAESEGVEHGLPGPVRVRHYWVPEGKHAAPARAAPVLMSYLDTCVEGYLAVFGAEGPARFFETTAGWDTPVLDDRARPFYARHTAPGAAVEAVTDAALARLGVRPLPLAAVVEELEQAGLAREGVGFLAAPRLARDQPGGQNPGQKPEQ